MIDNGPEGFMLIGLHKLAAQNGDGLVPELYELLMRRAEEQRRAANVATFPAWKTRRPGEALDQPLDEASREGANVIAFAPDVDKTVARRKKV
ncbi:MULTISPECIES: hypothetical protein [unclassified Rhizobium]|jgi:hypothetical protein|uniref:hypothetical protein n=1 Tax=unclassified Rhizobium TaxID=2613769 RepID=UPI000646C5C5|nr:MULTISPECIES: hypothetical protein [unclassified Rhizobium]MBN8949238.1 hypothetical protein [Rhizobium tropici]OJY75048.1 MAG: hypothetical protein BGP09_35165 [Rhizobium sp. 60-20]RKD70976.1 hypothetical protein BJ928_103499 [Rhizobium sp. WW_1]